MVFIQIWYLHKQGLQDQNKGITNCAEFTLQWWNYPIWRYCKVRLTTKFIGYRMRNNTQLTYQLAVGVNGVEELNVGLPLKHEVPNVLVLYFGEGRFSCVKLKNQTKIVLKWFTHHTKVYKNKWAFYKIFVG